MKTVKPTIRYWIFLASLTLMFASCNKYESIAPKIIDTNYYPLNLKSVSIYSADSTVYNDFNNSTTVHRFKIKDSVVSKFLDAVGEDVFRIERFKKETNGNWVFQKVITRKITNNRAEELLDNKKYVRLVFPTKLHTTWNGNLYNDLENWQHEIMAIDEPLSVGSLNLDSTLRILQYEEVNLIREDIYSEVYAKNIGLVEKEITAIDKDISSGRIKKGYVFKMQLDSSK